MLAGKTKSGFNYKISQERLDNYELLELMGELDDNPTVMPQVINMLLGKEQAIVLKNHVRNKDGIVPAKKISKEIEEIFANQDLKN